MVVVVFALMAVPKTLSFCHKNERATVGQKKMPSSTVQTPQDSFLVLKVKVKGGNSSGKQLCHQAWHIYRNRYINSV